MSILDEITLKAATSAEMQKIGHSLALSIYRKPITIILEGDLGAGKTTFVQGFAKGLGLQEAITSPTYALEQRYKDILSHIDLYRLQPAQAHEFLEQLDDWQGVRVIEWPERHEALSWDIRISMKETSDGSRTIVITFQDIPIPTEKEVQAWYKETRIQPHIIKHMECVATMTDNVVTSLLRNQRCIRKKAVHAAALCHDILRYADFKDTQAGNYPTSSDEEKTIWNTMKETYGTPHELAAEKFLQAKGYPDIGYIVRTHRGGGMDHAEQPKTIEQIVLMYADKRSLNDTSVTVDERFDDFMKRYGNGKESQASKEWRAAVKDAEKTLFPDGVPF